MTMLDDKLHGARLRHYALYLGDIDEESTVATHHRGVWAKVLFYLFGSGAQHVGAHITLT